MASEWMWRIRERLSPVKNTFSCHFTRPKLFWILSIWLGWMNVQPNRNRAEKAMSLGQALTLEAT